MKSNSPVHFNSDSVNLINLIIRHWKALLVTFFVAAVVSSVFSYTIDPLFRSSVLIYPGTNVVESQNLFGIQRTTTPLFGNETAIDKVLQIIRSDNIKNYLVRKYDLFKHYEIGENAKYRNTMLDARMKKLITSGKTQYNSIEISVLDSDPEMAAAIANDIARQIDTVFNLIVKEAGERTFKAVNNSYIEQLERVKSIEDSILLLSPKGTSAVLQVHLKAGLAYSNWAGASGQYSPEFLRLINMFESENENLSAIRIRLSEAKMLAMQDLQYIHIINEAKVAEKKAIPRRSLIVIASAFSTLFLMIFILGLSDSVKRDGE